MNRVYARKTLLYRIGTIGELVPCHQSVLPLEGHKFWRFSSKISGSHAEEVGEYMDTTTRVARISFGSRVRYWNEAADERGFYNWQEVHTSIESYEQVYCGILILTVEAF